MACKADCRVQKSTLRMIECTSPKHPVSCIESGDSERSKKKNDRMEGQMRSLGKKRHF